MATKTGLYYYTKEEVDELLEGIQPGGSFTPELKQKLVGIEEGAEVNVIETVKVNNTALTPDANRAVNVEIPTITGGAGITVTNNTVSMAHPLYYGTCGTWAADRQKNVDCTGFVLQDGVRVLVKFEHKAGDLLALQVRTLNVNSTGAKTITTPEYPNGFSSVPLWDDGELVEFYYDATSDTYKTVGRGVATMNNYGITRLTSDTTNDSTVLAASALAVKKVNDLVTTKATVLDCYPVGAYFETSDTSFNPNNTWGGTWEQPSTGRWHRTA